MALISARRQRHCARVVMRSPFAISNGSGKFSIEGSWSKLGSSGAGQSAPVFSRSYTGKISPPGAAPPALGGVPSSLGAPPAPPAPLFIGGSVSLVALPAPVLPGPLGSSAGGGSVGAAEPEPAGSLGWAV